MKGTRIRHRLFVGATALAVAFPLMALAAPLDLPNTFQDGEIISAATFNENFDAIAVAVNDNDARLTALEEGAMGAAIVPAGAVMFFNLESCPGGWEVVEELRGRVPLGIPLGATVGELSGTPLDLDNPTILVSEVPAHDHGVGDVDATATSDSHSHTAESTNSSHSHTIAGGHHDHDIPIGSSGLVTPGAAVGTANAPSGDMDVDTTASNHSHTVSGGGHTHGTDSVMHSHAITITGSTDDNVGPESVDVTMPYMQLLACQKM